MAGFHVGDSSCSAGRFSAVKYSPDPVGTTNRASGSLAPPIRTRGMPWVERGSQLTCAALIASHAPICALAHEPRESPAIIFHGNGSVGATGRRCRYKLAASGGSAGCVRQLQAPIWVTPIAGGYETAKNRGIFATLPHRALCGNAFFSAIKKALRGCLLAACGGRYASDWFKGLGVAVTDS